MSQIALTQEELGQLANQFETKSSEEIISWGVNTFSNEIILACSFGAEDVVLLDMLLNIDPQARVFYLDTDKHFKETYETRDRLEEKYNTTFIQMKPELTLEEQASKHGEELWKSNPDLCCNIRKVKPLTKVLSQHKAWITGIRRDQAPTRANTKKVEWDQTFGLIKLNPIASWSSEDVWTYIKANDIPYNPLHDQDYPSIGCSVCTQPVRNGEDPRSGRWGGFQKTECGLHNRK
jgi:phosphoadenosine phosphosulfate reductase